MDKEFGELKAAYSDASKNNDESLKDELISRMRDNLRRRNNGNDYVKSDIEDKTICLNTAGVNDLYVADGILARLATSQKREEVAKMKRQEYGVEQ